VFVSSSSTEVSQRSHCPNDKGLPSMRPVSSKSAHKPIGWSQGFAAISSTPVAHEARASFQPSEKPGRRAVAAGLDTLDLAERHEQTRRSGSRRRERLFAEQGYE
jgi:hypothetical protein